MTQKVVIEATPELIKDLVLSGIKEELEKIILMNKKIEDDKLITKEEACEILKCSPTTLWNWERKKILTPQRFGRLVRYRKEEIINFKK